MNRHTKSHISHKFILLSIVLLLGITSCANRNNNRTDYQTLTGFAQGSTYNITYKQTNNKIDLNLPDSLSVWFEMINKSISGYDSLSIISKINRGEKHLLDPIFTNIFNLSKKIYKESKGAFDISAGALYNLWGFGFQNKESVTQYKIDSILNIIGMNKLSIQNNQLISEQDGIQLNFNAIAQGYTCDFIGSKFDKLGITDYLIEVGGEVLTKGKSPKAREWRVGIDKPVDGNYVAGGDIQAIINISDRALVTSGNYRKFYVEDGVKYGHSIDPRSGYPAKNSILSVTVLAKSAAIADAYATYFMVIGLEEAKVILTNNPDMDALIIYSQGEDMITYTTPGINIEELE